MRIQELVFDPVMPWRPGHGERSDGSAKKIIEADTARYDHSPGPNGHWVMGAGRVELHLGHIVMDTLGNAARIGLVCARQKYPELVTGYAADDVAVSNGVSDCRRDAAKRLVAPTEAETAVDDFEVIELDEQNRAERIAAGRGVAIGLGIDKRREGRFVEAGRQAIVLCRFLCLLAQCRSSGREQPAGDCKRQPDKNRNRQREAKLSACGVRG